MLEGEIESTNRRNEASKLCGMLRGHSCDVTMTAAAGRLRRASLVWCGAALPHCQPAHPAASPQSPPTTTLITQQLASFTAAAVQMAAAAVALRPTSAAPAPAPPLLLPPAALPTAAAAGVISWTPAKVVATIALFIFAGLAEIGGGWLVWQAVREKKPWWWGVAGCLVLVAYGFIPTLQPAEAAFARVYAVYGGVFIVMSYFWGWAVDKVKPDVGDFVGAALALAGVCLCWFWPRKAAVEGGALVGHGHGT